MTQKNLLNQAISFSSKTNDYVVGNVQLGNWFNDYWPTIYPTYYPTTVYVEDKMSKAFRISKTLMDKKLVTMVTIKDFIELVMSIEKEL